MKRRSKMTALWYMWTVFLFPLLLVLFFSAGVGTAGISFLLTLCLGGQVYFLWRTKRKSRQLQAFFRQLQHLGIDFFDDGQTDYGTEEGMGKLVESIAFATNSEYSSQLLKVQAQINALNSQINPHFLYNTLEMIRSQALVKGAEDVANMAEALSTMFRYSISRANDLVTVREELENVRCYFMIQQYRFPNRFSLECLLPEDSELMECQIPKLTFQPIMENAIYHGLEKKVGKGTITLRIFTTGERLILRIRDDGVGMPPEQLQKLQHIIELGTSYVYEGNGKRNNGIALININQRIQLHYGREYGITISSVEQMGTTVEVTLPYKKKEEH